MRIVIIANGIPPAQSDIDRWLRAGDMLMCADGGAKAALALGLSPQHVIGDFDSLTTDELNALQQRGATLHHHPAHKDETDLELALLMAVGLFTTEHTDSTDSTDSMDKKEKTSVSSAIPVVEKEIVVLGALGGRIDHELANLLLLAMPALKGTRVVLAHGAQQLFAIDARDGEATAQLHAHAGDIVSLLPFNGDAHGITTAGLEYPLRNESLFVGPARGVSNVMLADEASVTVCAGMLLCVVTEREIGD
jgi:thiamine pyrophosphokinase